MNLWFQYLGVSQINQKKMDSFCSFPFFQFLNLPTLSLYQKDSNESNNSQKLIKWLYFSH